MLSTIINGINGTYIPTICDRQRFSLREVFREGVSAARIK
nr:MAG TPA: hypothetical protein [Caudoviricetes sp.]